MRVVLDTNVLVSAVISEPGSPAELLRLWEAGCFELAMSEDILSELERVIHYPKIRPRYSLPEERVQFLMALLRRHCVWSEVAVHLTAVTDDPTDDRYLECALAAGARYVVSGDSHLLALGSYQGVEILAAAGLVALLRLGQG